MNDINEHLTIAHSWGGVGWLPEQTNSILYDIMIVLQIQVTTC